MDRDHKHDVCKADVSCKPHCAITKHGNGCEYYDTLEDMKQLPEKQGVQTHINWTAFVQKR
jgi:hypothetical protein